MKTSFNFTLNILQCQEGSQIFTTLIKTGPSLKKGPSRCFSDWCERGDLNPYGCPPDPKSGASASSATLAFSMFIIPQPCWIVNVHILKITNSSSPACPVKTS